MSEIKQSKGFLNVKGRIIALNNKKIKETDKSKEVSFGLQISKDKVLFCKAFGYKKTDEDTILVEFYDELKKRQTRKDTYSNALWLEDGENVVGTKIKFEPNGEVKSFVDCDGVDQIKEHFKDGDTVHVVLGVEADSYFKNLKFTVNKIYASENELDFEDENFEEENHGRVWISYVNVENEILNAVAFTKKQEGVPLQFNLDTEYINANDFDFKQGDVIQIEFENFKTPIYEDVVVEDKKETNKFKPKGKYAKEVNKGSSTYKQVKEYIESLICTGISNKSEDAYDLTQFLTEDDSEEQPF